MSLLRGKRLAKQAERAIAFTASIGDDEPLYAHVVKINMAHMLMLIKRGLVEKEAGLKCLRALKALPGKIKLDPGLEDIHMNVEALVTKRAGSDAGGQLSLGKSRNDQVAAAIRMTLREFMLEIVDATLSLRVALLDQSEKYVDVVFPGYTHLQHAQPVTLGHHLLAHYDSLVRDVERHVQTYERINRSPMGAAALATSDLDLDRNMVAELLGFDGLVENSIDAVSSRDFAVEAMSNLAIQMIDLSRISEELILWSTSEFDYIESPDEYSSTSSIMPQKKNPVVAELIRAKTSVVSGELVAAMGILKALPFSYNIDLQELTPHVWNSCRIVHSSTVLMTEMLKRVKFHVPKVQALVKADMSTATRLANYLVTNYGVPFRAAHRVVGILVKECSATNNEFASFVSQEISDVSKAELRREIKIPLKEARDILSPVRAVEAHDIIGGPSPKDVRRAIKNRRESLQQSREWLHNQRKILTTADGMLERSIRVSGADGK